MASLYILRFRLSQVGALIGQREGARLGGSGALELERANLLARIRRTEAAPQFRARSSAGGVSSAAVQKMKKSALARRELRALAEARAKRRQAARNGGE